MSSTLICRHCWRCRLGHRDRRNFRLTDNATSAATGHLITSMPGGAPDYVPAPPIDVFASLLPVNSNVFTVSDGEVTSGKFNASFGPEGNGYVQLEPGTGAEGFPW